MKAEDREGMRMKGSRERKARRRRGWEREKRERREGRRRREERRRKGRREKDHSITRLLCLWSQEGVRLLFPPAQSTGWQV